MTNTTLTTKLDRDPEFNVLSPVGRRQSIKGLRKLRLPRPTLDSDRLYRARSNEDVHHTIVYNKAKTKQKIRSDLTLEHDKLNGDTSGSNGPPGQTPFPTVVAMSGYFPPNQLPPQGFYPPPPQHQYSYPPPAQPPQAPYYQAPAGYPGQTAPPPLPSTMQYSALGSTYAPAMYTSPTSTSEYPPAAEPPKAVESHEGYQQPQPAPSPPAYDLSPYAMPEVDEKNKERGFFSGYTAPAPAPAMPIPYPAGGMATMSAEASVGGGSFNYPYPTTAPQPANEDDKFWILYHQRYNGNEKQTRELVAEEMARQNAGGGGIQPAASFYYPSPAGSGAVPAAPAVAPGSQPYPSPAQPAMYQEYQYGQQQQQEPPKKDGPDWMKLAGGVAAGGLAVAGTKKLFDLIKGDKKADHHH
ncbi:hypothetical protein BGZ73_008366 [Actinomortierella ambigua]|nr:hypothetical protein BGZ73_008366 [Actinomortierella ambigua]